MSHKINDKDINVLLIEDNPGDVRLIREMLTETRNVRFNLDHADRLSAGLDYLAGASIDLILLDLSLPDSQGLDTFARVHALGPGVPIVVLTGLDDERVATQAMREGAQDYLVKGQFESDSLERAIYYAIERQRLVTNLKQQTSALLSSEARLHNMIEQNADSIIIVDGNGFIRFVNPAGEALFGRPAQELLGESFDSSILISETAELTIRRNGDQVAIAEMHVVETEWEGEFAYLATLRDITERKQAEEALRESEERFRRVITSISDHIYMSEITAEGKRLNRYLSLHVESLTGYPHEKFITDWSFWPLVVIHPDDRAAAAGQIERLTREQNSEMEYRLVRADGQVIWVRDSGRAEVEGTSRIIYGVVSDITQRKQYEHELEAITRVATALRAAITRTEMLPIILDELLDLIPVEGTALEMYDPAGGGTILELGRGAWVKAIGTYTPAGEGVSGHVLATGQTYINNRVQADSRLVEPDKLAGLQAVACVPLMVYKQPIGVLWVGHKDKITPEIVQLLTAISDIAANALHRAILFEELQHSNKVLAEERASLAQHVEARTAELRIANAELARAARLKDEFLANMSHELRTPLNAVLGMSEVLRNEVYGPLNEEQLRALSHIEEGGRHLLDLINDILDLSKIEAGKLELTIGPISVNDICQASLRFIKQMAQKKGIKVLSTTDNTIDTLQADQRRLKQILVNLLSNAVKFTPEGGQVGLEVEGDQAGQILHFTVWDTGIGISQEEMDHLFEPFVQIDSSLARQHEGTGLGLSLVSRLTEMHGGGVSLESEVGRGSRFTISLPWPEGNRDLTKDSHKHRSETEDIEATKEVPPGISIPEHHCTILLAEDNETNIIMIRDILQAKGYQVQVAHNGVEALERAREVQPDIILMDIQMPEMDGLETTRRLRADAQLAKIPIIALTALAMPQDRERCLAAGANDYLSKPVILQELIEAIENQLQRPK